MTGSQEVTGSIPVNSTFFLFLPGNKNSFTGIHNARRMRIAMEGHKAPMVLCIFEDDRYPNFFPLSLNKPVFELICGTQTLRERIVAEVNPERIILVCRGYLSKIMMEEISLDAGTKDILVNEVPESDILFVNGRLLAFGDEFEQLNKNITKDSIIEKNGTPVVALLSPEKALKFFEFITEALNDASVARVFTGLREINIDADVPEESALAEIISERESILGKWCGANGIRMEKTGLKLLSFYWQLIAENSSCLIDDFKKSPLRGYAPESELFKGVDIIKEDDVVIGPEVEVRSGTVLDASNGPIIIAAKVSIEPNSIIYGPCFVGEGSIIRGGAKIGNGTSLGRQCRIGGEVGETIIASFTNKQHDGFIGHSYIGSWVNIGAGTCNSDLKNNYSKIRAWSAGRVRDTGRRFLGLVTGDHVKIAINTRVNTGSVIGFCTNVMSVGFPPKFIPSFIWNTDPEIVEFDLDKAVKTAEIMMDRRNIEFSPAMAELFKKLNGFCRMAGRNV